MVTIDDVMRHLHNYFPACEPLRGAFSVVDGAITIPGLIPGQWFRIQGSVFNDGVYNDTHGLTDETWNGEITLLKPDKAFLSMCSDIAAWESANSERVLSPYNSESFGGYSYTLKTVDGGLPTWEQIFKKRLNAWRKT